ncbi:MAG: hypothetical protein Q4G36_05145 [Paracoccus sp. (in: a-proteobacteria)]|nr:hypothetical protein [Paracoccus sp. (in: a-proteobacteria)]
MTPRLRRALPYIAVAALFGMGLYALYRLLAPMDAAQVIAQIRTIPWRVTLLAVLTTFCGYLCLAGYDWSALRYIGKSLPGPVVLTGGLMAYAFGNTVGLTAISGGAVRWRIYGGLGLSGYDIAKISAFTSICFGVAGSVIGLIALAIEPSALTGVLPASPATIRAGAALSVVAVMAPLIWLSASGRSLRLGRIRIAMPRLPIIGAQMLISLGDLCFASLTLYLFLPTTGDSYLSFLPVFAAATLAGVLSHVPGGIGVFETVIIAAMPRGTPVDQVAAALLMFRLTYYLLPFGLALIVLALSEAVRITKGGLPGAAGRALQLLSPVAWALRPLVPMLLSVMILGSGLWMSLATLLPPLGDDLDTAETLFPLAFPGAPALSASALGAGLILLAFGVMWRSRGAFWLAMAALILSAPVAWVVSHDPHRAAGLMLAACILLPFRHSFDRRALLTDRALTPLWLAMIAAVAAGFGLFALIMHLAPPFHGELWWELATDEAAPPELRLGLLISLVVGLGALFLLIAGPSGEAAEPEKQPPMN